MAKSKSMKEMVDEYNKLTGKSIKKFRDAATAKKQLAAAKKKPSKSSWQRVKVNGTEYRSTTAAYIALKLRPSSINRVRKQLKEEGKAKLDDYTFTVVK